MFVARLALITGSILCLAGCRDAEVQAYRVPKEALPPPPPPGAAGHAHENPHGNPHALPAAAGATLTWQAPAHWQEQPAGGFRRGSFSIPGPDGSAADFSIIAFPGAAGGLAENLNRWRGQLGLPNQSQAQIDAGIEHFDGRGGLHFDLVDYAGTANGEPTRIVGAVAQFGGESWFFKVMGPDALVAGDKPAFIDFLHTVTPSAR
jgi:hypothetical protein